MHCLEIFFKLGYSEEKLRPTSQATVLRTRTRKKIYFYDTPRKANNLLLQKNCETRCKEQNRKLQNSKSHLHDIATIWTRWSPSQQIFFQHMLTKNY